MDVSFEAWRTRSPFYDESHEAIASAVRRFVDREAIGHIEAWEDAGEVPREINRRAGAAGILGLGFPEEYGGTSSGIDLFHVFAQNEELARPGSGGFWAALTAHAVPLPAIIALGSEEMKRRVVPPIIAGEKLLAIAVTEPSGGSDVARLRTRAERRGDRYIVNGSKVYISSGMRADHYVVAVRTGGDGMAGLSLLLVDSAGKGFSRTPMQKMGWHCSDTATLHFEDLEVPVENLIGPENGAFLRIMHTFNGERLGISHMCCAFARACLREALDWARQRETFGKRLIEHPVIRSKLADLVRRVDTTQAMVDLCAWRYREGKVQPNDIALLKVQATRMLERVTRECSQVLGGISYIRGSIVERLFRETRVLVIAGGSEEILLDMAGRYLSTPSA